MREIVLVLPQLLTTESVKVTTAEPQVSTAVALPVLLVLVSAGQSSVTLGGRVITGAVISRTVIVCVRLVALPHESVAVHSREIT